MNKVKRLLNRHAKEIFPVIREEYPGAVSIVCEAVEGGVIRSANKKQQQIKFSIEIEIVENLQ